MALGGGVAGVARIVVEADNRRLQTGLRQSEKHVEGFATRGRTALAGFASSFASLGAIGGAAGLGAILKSSIDAASDLNEEISKSKQIFGASAQEIEAWSRTASESMKISQREALSYSGALGSMLKTVGVSGPQLSDMSQRIVQLGADMASFANEDPSDMLDRLRAGLAGEAEPLRRFGVLLSEAAVTQEAVRMGLVRQGVTLTEQEKVLARYSLIMRQTADQQGDVARTGGQLAGQQRELRARLEDLQATLGQKLLPIQLKVISQLSDWATELQNNKQLQRDIRNAVDEASDAISDAAEIVKEIVDLMGGWKNASQFIIAGTLVAKLRGLTTGFTALAGAQAAAGGTGIAGAAGQATKLRTTLLALSRFAPIIIPIEIAIAQKLLGNDLLGLTAYAQHHSLVDILFGTPGNRGVIGTAIVGSGLPDTPANRFSGARRVVETPTGFAGFPGGGTHSRTERGYIWQDDDAVDINMKPGSKVYAIEAGVLHGARYGGDSGRFSGWGVTLVADSGNQYFYKHMKSLYVRKGRVIEGQLIGAGTTTGHLHFAKKGATTAADVLSRGGRPAAPAPTQDTSDLVPDTPRGDPDKEKKKPAAKRATGVLVELIPALLENRLARAELTKPLADDLKALRDIETWLEKRLAATKKIAEKTKILRELKDIRGQIEGILTEAAVDREAIDKMIEKITQPIEALVSGGPDSRPATMFSPGADFQAGVQTPEGKAALGKLLASFEPEKQRIREWAKAMQLKKDAELARIKAAKDALAKLRRTPKRLQGQPGFKAAEAKLVAEIKARQENVAALDAGIERAFEAWGVLETEETSQVQRLAEEDEQARSQPPDRGGGDSGFGGGGDFGGGGAAAEPPAPIDMQAQIAAVLAQRSRFISEFSSDVFSPGAFGFEFGSTPQTTINNYFTTPPPEPFAWLRSMSFQAR